MNPPSIRALSISCTIKALSLSLLLIFSPASNALAKPDLDYIKKNKTRLNQLFASLDPKQKNLLTILEHYKEGRLQQACESLVLYYKERGIDQRLLPVMQGVSTPATDVMEDKFKLQDITTVQPRLENGLYDWNYKGPNGDPEWAWFFNRHYYFRYLYTAWHKERHKLYFISKINDTVIDWICSNPPPAFTSFSPGWRALEVARRIEKPWIEVFFQLQELDEFSHEARLLMLSSIPEHAEYLIAHHSFDGNHLLTEMMALALISLAWPEFESSERWLNYAFDKIAFELDKQTYPDGAYKELSNHYQRVALRSFQRALDLMIISNQKDKINYLWPKTEQMWGYFANVMRPNGEGLLNNDSDLEGNRMLLGEAFTNYQREDWKWLHTQGIQGEAPHGLPSRYYPWAGHAIMRSDWGADAQWAFFDIGPHGSDHQHHDRLHISISMGQQDYLVDAGRFTYKPGVIRDYFKGAQAHNVILIDGKGSAAPPDTINSPLDNFYEITESYDLFSAQVSFSQNPLTGQGTSYHKRTVRYIRGQHWEVTDQIMAYGSHRIEVLWHFHPDCSVNLSDDGIVRTQFKDKKNLAIIPKHKDKWEVKLIRGQDTPVQGWYSGKYNKRKAATVAIYSRIISKPESFEWLITPQSSSSTESENLAGGPSGFSSD